MMKHLIKNQQRIFVNTLRSQELKNYFAYLVIFAVLGALLFLFSQTIWNIAGSVTEPVLAGIFSYSLLMIIGMVILIGMPQVFKQLYSATDLEFLFTMPIKTKHIFLMKYLQSFIGTPLFAFFFFLIPFAAYGVASNANILYYFVLILVLFAASTIGLSIAYLLNLIVIQFVPASRANEFMTAMSFLSGLLVYLLFMLPQISSGRSFTESLMAGLPILPDWVPVSWGSNALIDATNGSLSFFLPLILFLLLTIVSILLTTTLVEKGFRTGWIRLSEGSGKKKKRKPKKERAQGVSHPVIAIGKKEWFSIKRDMREWMAFLPLAFLIVFPVIGFFMGGDVRLSDLHGFNDISWPIAQGFFLFIYALFNGQIAAAAISREGLSAWILRTLPLAGRDIALGKLWISWLLPFIILTILECIVGVFLGWTWWQFIFGIVVKAGITIGISSIGIWIGTIGAKFNPSNPQQRLTFGTSMFLLLLAYVYLAVLSIPYALMLVSGEAAPLVVEMGNDSSGFFGFVFNVFGVLLTWKASHPIVVISLGLLLMFILSFGIAWLFLSVSAKRINRGVTIDIVSETSGKSVFKRKSGGSLY
ncbi:putative ABC transporter permease subunit [Oceanobacillus neutriphilus]|uniref:ABC-2 type transport system permease protein n=1 Tax=Oceanobacillus neutriphilus TaxID=531815 RepID=A0ABQ2NQ90_9BACI|nr:hypothetical protein [Oceanobacillus neutriphilus]GGP09106.1 hypothetical protein GCM10011346_11830 [Oceanobacillus neutriphilus]